MSFNYFKHHTISIRQNPVNIFDNSIAKRQNKRKIPVASKDKQCTEPFDRRLKQQYKQFFTQVVHERILIPKNSQLFPRSIVNVSTQMLT